MTAAQATREKKRKKGLLQYGLARKLLLIQRSEGEMEGAS